MSTASTLAAAGLEVPPRSSIVSYEERPDLDPAIDELLDATWPAFMLEDEVANAHFGRAYESWPALQTMLLGLVFGVLAAVSDSTWAIAAGTARTWFARRPTRLDALSATGGTMMIGLGATMLTVD